MNQTKVFTASDIAGHNVHLIGDTPEKKNTCRTIIDTWKNVPGRGALVVFDYDGSLYRDYGHMGVLVDLISRNSVFPDCLMPFLRHPKIGVNPASISDAVKDILVPEFTDRSSNDVFWRQNGEEVIRQYLEYAMVMDKKSYIGYQTDKNKNNKYNSTLLLSQYHDELDRTMYAVASGSIRDPLLELPAMQCSPELTAYLAKFGISCPFESTLKNGGNMSAGTSMSIIRSARAYGKDLFCFMKKLSQDRREMCRFPVFDIIDYVRKPDKVLFLCPSGCRGNDSILSSFLLGAVAIASECEGKKTTILIPEADKWNNFSQIEKIALQFQSSTSFVLGHSSFCVSGNGNALTKGQILDAIDDMSDIVIWHRSLESSLQMRFRERIPVKDAAYDLSDLGTNGLIAVESRYAAFKYMYLAPPLNRSKKTYVRERADSFLRRGGKKTTWFFDNQTYIQLGEADNSNDIDIDI
jgi:hypothetical protein